MHLQSNFRRNCAMGCKRHTIKENFRQKNASHRTKHKVVYREFCARTTFQAVDIDKSLVLHALLMSTWWQTCFIFFLDLMGDYC